MSNQPANESAAREAKSALALALAKSGFDNAQARITAVDTKVGIALGLMILLLPAPLVIVGRIIGLEKNTTSNIWTACSHSWFLSSILGLALVFGMISAFMAIIHAIACLGPRAPKEYGRQGPFQNEWKPNILFPLYHPEQYEAFTIHIKKLETDVDFVFVIAEYEHQLHQLGRILHEKFAAMGKCFRWLKLCLISYGVAIFAGLLVGLIALC